MSDDRRATGLPFSTFDFLQAAGDVDREALAENQPQLRPKPRASSLMSDARVIAYSMANVPLSDPHREDPDKIDLGFTQATGRLVEPLNRAALARVLPAGYWLLDTPLCIGHPACPEKTNMHAKVDHWATGHPDDIVVRPDGRFILVSYKHWGRFAFKEITLDGVDTRRTKKGDYSKGSELFAQEAVYGAGLDEPPAEAWWFIIAQDASGAKFEFRQKAFTNKNPNPKAYLVARDWEDIEHCVPYLRARAEWFSAWFRTDGDPTHVALEHTPPPPNWRELPAAEVYPWGYTEYETRVLADPPGHLVAPKPLPW